MKALAGKTVLTPPDGQHTDSSPCWKSLMLLGMLSIRGQHTALSLWLHHWDKGFRYALGIDAALEGISVQL